MPRALSRIISIEDRTSAWIMLNSSSRLLRTTKDGPAVFDNDGVALDQSGSEASVPPDFGFGSSRPDRRVWRSAAAPTAGCRCDNRLARAAGRRSRFQWSQSVQNRPAKPGLASDSGVAVQRVQIAIEPVQQRLFGARPQIHQDIGSGLWSLLGRGRRAG